MKTATIDATMLALCRKAAGLLTGAKRRAYQAECASALCQGNARAAEALFGWRRQTVTLGLEEARSGITCLDNFQARGGKKMEVLCPQLETDIRALVDPHSQADAQLKTALAYTRLSAQSVRRALVSEKGWAGSRPAGRAHHDHHAQPPGLPLARGDQDPARKKTRECEAIFANVAARREAAEADPKSLRLSLDTKASVVLGEFSRRGQARGLAAVQALDHDLATKEKLIPVGILEVASGELDLTFATSHKTSDLLADCLEAWWQRRSPNLGHIEELVLHADNGPESSGRRTQLLARLADFADQSGLRLRLVYYPPYHSKYNPIERCWGVLERHWNGTLLRDVDTALGWARTMTWRGIAPVVKLTRKLYEKSVKVTGKAKQALEARLQRSPTLRWWDILIEPRKV